MVETAAYVMRHLEKAEQRSPDTQSDALRPASMLFYLLSMPLCFDSIPKTHLHQYVPPIEF